MLEDKHFSVHACAACLASLWLNYHQKELKCTKPNQTSITCQHDQLCLVSSTTINTHCSWHLAGVSFGNFPKIAMRGYCASHVSFSIGSKQPKFHTKNYSKCLLFVSKTVRVYIIRVWMMRYSYLLISVACRNKYVISNVP